MSRVDYVSQVYLGDCFQTNESIYPPNQTNSTLGKEVGKEELGRCGGKSTSVTHRSVVCIGSYSHCRSAIISTDKNATQR